MGSDILPHPSRQANDNPFINTTEQMPSLVKNRPTFCGVSGRISAKVPRHKAMRLIAEIQTDFQPLSVWGSDREREFRVAGAVHAWWHRERFLTGLAWDAIAAAVLLHPGGPPASVLMLGLAGGTSLRILRHLLPEARITAVEIDPHILELGREHMALDELGVETVIADAYVWLRKNRRRFDVVVDDVYRATDDDVVRPGAYDDRTAAALRRAVAENGLLAANLITGRGHRLTQSKFRAFFRSAFPEVRSVTTPDSANEVLVGGATVLTRQALAPWWEKFPDARDRRYWDALNVRRLR